MGKRDRNWPVQSGTASPSTSPEDPTDVEDSPASVSVTAETEAPPVSAASDTEAPPVSELEAEDALEEPPVLFIEKATHSLAGEYVLRTHMFFHACRDLPPGSRVTLTHAEAVMALEHKTAVPFVAE